MVHDYQETALHISEDYTKWFIQATDILLNAPALPAVALPDSFAKWMEHEATNPSMPSEIIHTLDILYNALDVQTRSLCKETYKQLAVAYEEFITYINRLAYGGAEEAMSIEISTGLRSVNYMSRDMAREQERLLRHGNSFVLILLRVNCSEERGDRLQLVADRVKKSLRTFDDAYYIGDNEIVVSLKQTSIAGGKQMLRRLQSEIAPQASFSASLTCPTPRENIDELIECLREDITDRASHADMIIEYQALSPIQRYVMAKT